MPVSYFKMRRLARRHQRALAQQERLSRKTPRTYTCWYCGRVGSRGFAEAELKDSGRVVIVCQSAKACESRARKKRS
jgi:hypothetical protein